MLVKTEKVNCIICNKDNDIYGQGIDYEFKTCANLWSTKHCKECDHYYLDNRPSIAEADIIYPSDYYPAINDPNLTESIILKVRYLIEKRRYKSLIEYFSKDPCIVDVGAGDGRVLGYLRTIFGPKIRLIAVDLDIAEDTKQFFSDKDIIYFETAIEDFNFDENVGSADIIIMTQVVEHLWEPIKVIEEIKEILTPRGVIFIETPNPNSLCKKVQGSQYWGGWHRPRHINLFTRKSLTLIIEKLNMNVVTYQEYVVPAFWVMGVRNFFALSTNGQNHSVLNFISLKNIFTLIIFTLIEQIIGSLKLGLSNHRFIISKRKNDV